MSTKQIREKDDDYVASQKSMEAEELTGREGEWPCPRTYSQTPVTRATPNRICFSTMQKLIDRLYQLGLTNRPLSVLSGKLYYNSPIPTISGTRVRRNAALDDHRHSRQSHARTDDSDLAKLFGHETKVRSNRMTPARRPGNLATASNENDLLQGRIRLLGSGACARNS